MADFLPWMPLYFEDFERATRDFDDTARMAYLRLLWFHWERGYVPAGERALARIANQPHGRFKRMWDECLSAKFVRGEAPDQLVNLRGLDERANALAKRGQKVEAGLASAAARRLRAANGKATAAATSVGTSVATDVGTGVATSVATSVATDVGTNVATDVERPLERPLTTDYRDTATYSENTPPAPEHTGARPGALADPHAPATADPHTDTHTPAREEASPPESAAAARAPHVHLDRAPATADRDARSDLIAHCTALVGIPTRAATSLPPADLVTTIAVLAQRAALDLDIGEHAAATRICDAYDGLRAARELSKRPGWRRDKLLDHADAIGRIVAGVDPMPPPWTPPGAPGKGRKGLVVPVLGAEKRRDV